MPTTTRTGVLRTGALALALAMGVALAACGDDDDGGGGGGGGGQAITVGAATFPESNILAQIYGQALEAEGFDVTVEESFGARAALLDGLGDGSVDLTPEYVGALLNELAGPDTATSDTAESVGLLEDAAAEDDLVVFEASDAEDVDALAVTPETAEELGLETYSDLAEAAGDLTLGAPPECAELAACIPGLRDTYGIEFGEFVPLEAGPTIFEALESEQIDVARVFSTDPPIGENDLVVLEDDMGLNPVQNVIPVGSADLDTQDVADVVNAVSAALTTETLIDLNARAIIDKEDAKDVAADFLEQEGLV